MLYIVVWGKILQITRVRKTKQTTPLNTVRFRYKFLKYPLWIAHCSLVNTRSRWSLRLVRKIPCYVWTYELNSLLSSDAIWRHISGSTLAQVMTCYVTPPSHYFNPYWLVINGICGTCQFHVEFSIYQFIKWFQKYTFKVIIRGQWVDLRLRIYSTLFSIKLAQHLVVLVLLWLFCGLEDQWFMNFIHSCSSGSPDSKVHGANKGPIWGRQDPGGPHVGPMNFAIWVPSLALGHPYDCLSARKINLEDMENIGGPHDNKAQRMCF